MFVLTVKFKSALAYDEVVGMMEDRAPEFQALPGLSQKYYGYEEATGAYTGVYIWESEEAMLEYRQSELAQTIAAAYQATETPRVEIFNMIRALRPLEEPVAAS